MRISLTIEAKVDVEARLAYGREEHTEAKTEAICAQCNNGRDGYIVSSKCTHFRRRRSIGKEM